MVLLIRSSYPPWLRHKCGFKCASFDFTYGQAKSQGNPMDFNQPPGFLYLGECSGSDQYIYIVYIYIERILHGPGYFMNLPCSYMRLCLYVIMQELPNALNLMAPDCGSWGIPARGTTRRAFHNYLGCSYPFVLSGNLMVARSLDLQYVIHLTWLCSTYIYEHQNLSPFWGWYCAVWWSWHDVPSSSLKIPMEVWFFGTTDLNTWPTWWHLNLS